MQHKYEQMKNGFMALVSEEPELLVLLTEVKAIRRPPTGYFCANDVWYGHSTLQHAWPGIKPRLQGLVGWHARNPKLRTSEAYDLAYQYLYKRLPDCRECSCE